MPKQEAVRIGPSSRRGRLQPKLAFQQAKILQNLELPQYKNPPKTRICPKQDDVQTGLDPLPGKGRAVHQEDRNAVTEVKDDDKPRPNNSTVFLSEGSPEGALCKF